MISVVMAAPASRSGAGSRIDVTGKALGLDLLQIFLPEGVAVLSEVVQEIPGIQAAIVPIREDQPQGVSADRFDALDIDMTLAGLQDFLTGSMSTRLGRWGVHAQELEVEFVTLVLFIDKLKLARLLVQLDFVRNRGVAINTRHDDLRSWGDSLPYSPHSDAETGQRVS